MSTPSQSYQGPERRIDPDNKLGLDFHAPRALARFENLDPAARRQAIATADFREGDTMRHKLTRYLDQIKGVRTPEQLKLISNLEAQYAAALADWEGKIDVTDAPTKERVAAWLNNLSSETLNGMLKHGMRQFQLVPKGLTTDLLKVVSGTAHWGQWKKVKIAKWTFGVTNGQEDMPFDETFFYKDQEKKVERTNEEIPEEAERRFALDGIKLMPQYAYVPAHTRAKAQGVRLDRQFWTAFKLPVGAYFVPRAESSRGGRITLYGNGPGNSIDGLRVRPWVGEMEND